MGNRSQKHAAEFDSHVDHHYVR